MRTCTILNLPHRGKAARGLAAAAVWLAALALPAPALRAQAPDAPRVVDVRVDPAAGRILIGTPFVLEIRVQSPPGGRWRLPPFPRRYGDLTLRGARLAPADRAGFATIRIEWQAFRTGRVPLPAVPLVWRSAAGAERPVGYPPGEITVESMLRGAGPFAPRPPRGGLAVPAGGMPVWLWLAGGALLAAAAAGGLLWRRRRRPGPDVASPREVTLAYFRERLERVWSQREGARSPQELSGRLVDVFRDFLAWRFRTELHALTSTELCERLAEPALAGPERVAVVRTALAAADESRFSFTAADARALVASFLEIMDAMGPRDAVPVHDTQVRPA
jgi:hypothetical protein